MRVVVGSGSSRDFKQADLDRHSEMVSRFVARMRDAGKAQATLTLILRSASSCPAKALVAMKDELIGASIGAKAILARLEPAEDLRELFASLSELAPREHSCELIRWARNPRLLERVGIDWAAFVNCLRRKITMDPAEDLPPVIDNVDFVILLDQESRQLRSSTASPHNHYVHVRTPS